MKKILIIEDDLFLGETLIKKLNNEGFETLLSRDGLDGLEKIRTFNPDLILLDIILPNMNGYEILEEKQKDPTISIIPVIVISNSGQPVEISRVLSLGARDYIVKAQFSPEEVLEKVKTQLNTEGENILNTENNNSETKNPEDKLKDKKIVWVEDDPLLNAIISRKLSTTKCNFFHANDGEEALKIINTEIPDIIMLDIILPGEDGFQILSKIKSNPDTKNIPVVILSNLGQPNEIERGKELGAHKFIIKATVTPDEIIDNMEEILNS